MKFALEKQKIIFMAGKLGNPISQRIIGFESGLEELI